MFAVLSLFHRSKRVLKTLNLHRLMKNVDKTQAFIWIITNFHGTCKRTTFNQKLIGKSWSWQFSVDWHMVKFGEFWFEHPLGKNLLHCCPIFSASNHHKLAQFKECWADYLKVVTIPVINTTYPTVLVVIWLLHLYTNQLVLLVNHYSTVKATCQLLQSIAWSWHHNIIPVNINLNLVFTKSYVFTLCCIQ